MARRKYSKKSKRRSYKKTYKRSRRSSGIDTVLRNAYKIANAGSYEKETTDKIDKYVLGLNALKSNLLNTGQMAPGGFMVSGKTAAENYQWPTLVGGRGAYKIGKMLRKAGKMAAGAAIGYATGGPMGAVQGSGILGQGAYSMDTNDLVNGAPGSDDDSMVYSNSEYITDITCPSVVGSFINTPWYLNPGLQSVFPWLSQIVANYEEYEFLQLLFEYRSTIDASTVGNGQTGTLLMSTQYNATSTPFSDKEAMLQYFGSQSGKLTQNAIHGVECDPEKLNDKRLYVRSGPVPLGEDAKSYDHGIFNMAIIGAPANFANQQIGELWVTYTVRCRKAKFFANRGMGIQRDYFLSSAPGDAGNLWRYTDFTSGLQYKGQQNNIGIQVFGNGFPSSTTGLPVSMATTKCDTGLAYGTPITDASGNIASGYTVIVFPNQLTGYFKIRLLLEGSGLNGGIVGAGTPAGVKSGNVIVMTDQFATGAAGDAPAQAAAINSATNMMYELNVYVTQATNGVLNTLSFVYGVSSGTTTQYVIEVHESNPQFLRSTNNTNSCSPNFVNMLTGAVTVNPV